MGSAEHACPLLFGIPSHRVFFPQELSALVGDCRDANKLTEKLHKEHADSVEHALVAAEMMVLLDPKRTAEAVKLATAKLAPASRETLVKVLAFVSKHDAGAADGYRQKCAALYPLATSFNPELAKASAAAAASASAAAAAAAAAAPDAGAK